MKNILLSIFAAALFAAACTTKDTSTQQLQDEVIAIHDEIMPLMGSFARNSIAIDSIANNFRQLKAEQPALDTVEQKESLMKLQADIEEARDAMNDWMRKLELDFEGKPTEEVEKYLQAEKVKIEEIKAKFHEVEKRSEEILQPYKNINTHKHE